MSLRDLARQAAAEKYKATAQLVPRSAPGHVNMNYQQNSQAAHRESVHHREERTPAFKKFCATELYCPKCNAAMPVREKELLVLPTGALYDYLCSRCGTTLGSRKA